MNTNLAKYAVECEWKGKSASFEVVAADFAAACLVARTTCRKTVGMPPSSVVRVRHVADLS